MSELARELLGRRDQLNGAKAPRGRRGVQCVQNQARPMLGLPATIRACLFDLDGVLTQTATAHAAAWKEMFDAFLRARAAETGEAFVPFDPIADYRAYVDGKPRYDGVRSFLASRGIEDRKSTRLNSSHVKNSYAVSCLNKK